MGWLVSLAPVGCRGQVGSIRLQDNTIHGYRCRAIRHASVLEGVGASDTHVESEFQNPLCVIRGTTEAMKNPADAFGIIGCLLLFA